MIDVPTPAKLPGLRVTAFVMTMGSLLLLSVITPLIRNYGHSNRYPELAFSFAYLAVWLFVLGIGLERRSSWAWEGTVYLVALWMFAVLAILLVSLSSKNAKLHTTIGFFVVGLILIVPALLLFRYLLRLNVRTAFDPEAISGRSVTTKWMRLIAMANLINSGICLMELFNPTMNPLFGVIYNQIAISTFAVASALVMVYSGLGLYRLSEQARRVAIGFIVLSLIQSLTWLFLGPAPSGRFTQFRIVCLFLTAAISIAQIWYLHSRRHLFSKS